MSLITPSRLLNPLDLPSAGLLAVENLGVRIPFCGIFQRRAITVQFYSFLESLISGEGCLLLKERLTPSSYTGDKYKHPSITKNKLWHHGPADGISRRSQLRSPGVVRRGDLLSSHHGIYSLSSKGRLLVQHEGT